MSRITRPDGVPFYDTEHERYDTPEPAAPTGPVPLLRIEYPPGITHGPMRPYSDAYVRRGRRVGDTLSRS